MDARQLKNRPETMTPCADAEVCAQAAPEPRVRRRLTFRQERQLVAALFLGFVAIAAIVAAMIGGCSSDMHSARWAIPTRGAEAGHQGSSWELVFSSPLVAYADAGSDPRSRPEYSRRNEALTYRPPTPQLATTEWPEAPRPDLAYSRRIFLEPRADTLLWFQSSRAYDGRYWRDGYAVPSETWSYPTGP